MTKITNQKRLEFLILNFEVIWTCPPITVLLLVLDEVA
jgi:hypothetical protein